MILSSWKYSVWEIVNVGLILICDSILWLYMCNNCCCDFCHILQDTRTMAPVGLVNMLGWCSSPEVGIISLVAFFILSITLLALCAKCHRWGKLNNEVWKYMCYICLHYIIKLKSTPQCHSIETIGTRITVTECMSNATQYKNKSSPVWSGWFRPGNASVVIHTLSTTAEWTCQTTLVVLMKGVGGLKRTKHRSADKNLSSWAKWVGPESTGFNSLMVLVIPVCLYSHQCCACVLHTILLWLSCQTYQWCRRIVG